MWKRKRFLLFFLICCLLCFHLFWHGNQLVVKKYSVQGIPVKILLLSDWHNSDLGISETIQELQPDMILIPGDLVNAEQDNVDSAKELLELAVSVAPTYVSFGNHEIEFEERTGIKLASIFREVGAVVVDKEYVDIVINDESIRIGGIYGYCLPERYNNNNEDEIDFLREFENTDSYKILLSHLPYSWTHYGISEDYDIDLVLAGHTHGGQIILPFVGGLYDPEFGFFPGKVSGRFDSNDTTVIVSNGIGSANEILSRLNKPEIVIIMPDGF